MSLFICVHRITEPNPATETRLAHPEALDGNQGYGGICLRSWIEHDQTRVVCLIEADNIQLAENLHRQLPCVDLIEALHVTDMH